MQETLRESFRLSPQQRHLCALMHGEETFPYRTHLTIQLEGSLDVSRLRRAMQRLVERYEILRTDFPTLPAFTMPVQVINPETQLSLNVHDCSHLSSQKQAAELLSACEALRNRPLDLAKGPAWRVEIMRCDTQQHWMLWDLAAMNADMQTCHILLQELSQEYAEEDRQEDEEPYQYADLAEWQYEVLEAEEAAAGRVYWRTNGAALQHPASLPYAHLANELLPFIPQSCSLELAPALLRQLRDLARRLDVTESSILLACWGSVLSRLTAQETLLIGTEHDGRKYAELAAAIGTFAKTLPLVYRFPAGALFREVVEQTARKIDEGHAWQEYFSWQRVQASIEGVEPFCPYGFAYETLPPPWQEGSITWRVAEQGIYQDRFHVALACLKSLASMSVNLHYDQSIFEQEDMQRLLMQWQHVLEQVLVNPDITLHALQLLNAEQQRLILHEWNATWAEYPSERGVQQLFEEQVEHTPAAIAVLWGDEQITYWDLDSQANRLAHYLRRHGVGPEVRVGICLPRSPQVLVAILAVLKAGGAYVPIDGGLPPERLTFIMHDASISLLITQDEITHTLALPGIEEVHLDQLQEQLTQEKNTAPSWRGTAQNLAYMIYTSGSTGRPKGVMITQQGLVNYVHWARQAYCSQPGRGALLHSPLGFDLTVTSIFLPLLSGQAVEILGEGQGLEGLVERLKQRPQWNLLKVTPAHLEALSTTHLQQELAESAQVLILGGEALGYKTLAWWQQWAPNCRVINEYGPTETVVGCCVYEVPAGKAPEQGSVPIGKPIANTQLYVLDPQQQPVPIGIIGELYIGGLGLARGYWQRPEQTAERFVPNPFSTLAGDRLYRTGDLARYRTDGTLEYLGRLDNQVKLRGYRIELGEIEVVLNQHPRVKQSIVLVQGDEDAEKRLVAYVVTEEERAISGGEQELRAFLKERLPEYMLPTHFVALEQLPLTTNGKVDRKALPLPEEHQSSWQRERYAAPVTPLQQQLASIWSELLLRPHLGITDNFFELGGHSLLAMQVIAHVQQALGVELALRTLFEAPTIAELAQRIEALQQLGSSEGLPPLVPMAHPELLPLSFAQQRLWFLDQLEPGNITYTIPSALRITGSLSFEALEQSLRQIVKRHESLRTTFITQQDVVIQHIATDIPLQVLLIELSGFVPDQREELIQQLAREEVHRPFDLAHGPLLRVRLLRLQPQEHILLFNMHHIISDGWSIGVLVREFTTLYQAAVRGESLELTPLPIQYADYTLWQRQWLQDEQLQQQLEYWQAHLADAPPLLDLPTDRPRPQVQSYVGAEFSLHLAQELRQGLEALSQQQGATLFMTLLASFQLLLMRYSGQSDLVIGTPVANRRHRELEGLIGLFVNTLALRGDLSGDPTFLEQLARTREVCLGAYAHQDVPLEQVVTSLPVERSLSYAPLFQVLFALQNVPQQNMALDQATLEVVEFERRSSKFDLTVQVQESEQGLQTSVEYNTDLFDATTIQRLMQHWQQLLQTLVTEPRQRLSAFALLSPTEREQLLVQWNQTRREWEAPLHIHALLARQAERFPDRLAVSGPDGQLTYAALQQQVQRLARRLQALGVGPETLVGLYLERSAAFLISVLATWRCAGASVPLDPAYPQQRVQTMLQQSALPLLLTRSQLRHGLPSEGTRVLCLDELAETSEHETWVEPPLLDEQLAYVIYTSGSTGQPKGVMVTQQGMRNHLWAKVEALSLGEEDVVAQTASQCFDISVWQLFAGLLHGGRVAILPDAVAHDPWQLLRAVEEGGISILQVVPSLLGALLDQEGGQVLSQSRVRWVSVTGEAMPVELCRRWWREEQVLPALLNAYGPTECSDDVTHAVLQQPEEQAGTWRVPIGRPLANTQLYVLDEQMQPVPAGVIGELYVGGMGVGRGYLNEPEKTAGVFVPDPYGGKAGARVYRTGDRVRYRGDEQLEFVERQDEQVKLRGYRIELGEIEAALNKQRQIKQSVVVLRAETGEEKRLVAYIVPEAGEVVQPGSEGELRSALKERLPEYMLPAQFVLLDALPLSPNGKVDRRQLPAVTWQATEQQDEARLLGPLEELVLQSWQEVLQREQPGLFENFFEIGGHSLLATQVISRLRHMTGADIPVRTLFEAPTIAQLSKRLQQLLSQGHQQREVPPLVPVSRNQRLPLSFAQQRLWFLSQLAPESSAYTIPFTVSFQGQLDQRALQLSLEQVIQRHEVLRTTFHQQAGEPFQVIAPRAKVQIALVDLQALPLAQRQREAQALSAQEVSVPFDLEKGPLLRCRLLRLDEQDHWLQLSMHHIISDGWSSAILVRELTSLYQGLHTGNEVVLPPLPIQYADYALWQRSWLQGEVLREQIRYWTQQLSEARSVQIPGDRAPQIVRSERGASYEWTITEDLTRELKHLSRQEGVTLFMLLLAGWQTLLYRLSGQEDIVVGTDSANRSHLETEGLIGFFVNLLALRTRVIGNAPFRDILHEVRETVLGAYTHQELPFEIVVEHLHLERVGNRTPLVNTLFVMQNVPAIEVELPDLHENSINSGTTFAKFDLALFVTEVPGAGLACGLNYSTDMYEEETIARIMSHYNELLRNIVAHPDSVIDTLDYYTQEEKQLRATQQKKRLSQHLSKLKGFKDGTDLS
ncbi:hypothetical protein KSD_77730 [Ktedonobacter sp. SOSP1-85]|uniref:non-ribosomal peptide synthetase n=1 Tax=Ktedonobacter sp. SOSP1-85 TaxID=2778367 RepID=UPI0019155B04|nr:non-ribosomal peptide synthetase [Ktedonobacter sp. SOSP1-85]GHO80002.1 hypothetical protein KSD_77730 [Ktedonobacter sp. SOSP1-85]